MHFPISVFIISSSYPKDLRDWKGIFIQQMINSLAGNHLVRIAYWGPPGIIPANVDYACSSNEGDWLNWLMDQGGIAHLLRKRDGRSLLIVSKLLYFLSFAYRRQKNIKIFHVNWLQNAIPLWRTKTPALVTVFGNDYGLLKLPGMTTLLRFVLKRRSCIIAPNAEWMKPELEQRFGDIARIITIPLGINDKWFSVKRVDSYGDKSRWLVVSRLTRRKIGFLFDWGKDIFSGNSRHELHLFGPMQEDIQIPDWVHYHGSTHPQDLCENWFPYAAGLITLSQHDEGRPQVMLEAMASGVPVLASNLPAHQDFISHKKTGVLVGTEEEYVEGIKWLNNIDNNKKISLCAREWVKKEIGTWADCANRYIKCYNDLLDMEC